MRPGGRGARWIHVSARAGVWGFLAALVPALAEVVGAPLAPSLTGPVSAAGLVVSGLGTAVAAGLVWRALPRGRSALRAAAALGVPLGAALTLGGIALLRPLGRLADLVDAARWGVLALAVAVVVLLVWSFLVGRPRR